MTLAQANRKGGKVMDALKVHEIMREQLDHESRLVWQRLPALIVTNSVLLIGLLMSLSYKHI